MNQSSRVMFIANNVLYNYILYNIKNVLILIILKFLSVRQLTVTVIKTIIINYKY